MAGIDLGVIRQAEQPLDDAGTKLLVVAAWQVGAPDAAAEKRITSEDPALDFGIETDAADGMTRRADDFKGTLPYLDAFAVFKVAVGHFEVVLGRHSKPGGLLLGVSIISFHVGMRCHRDAVTLLHGSIADDMIDVSMGADGQKRLEAVAVDEAEEFVLLAWIGTAGVDEDTFFGIVVVNDIGAFREGIKDKFFEFEHILYV